MTLQWHARTSLPRAAPARDLGTLFRRRSAGDARAREAIILRFLPYARRLARRYEGRGEPVEDVYQAASVGLIKAVDRYEPERGESFVAYAQPTILGEIKRHFRDTTWRIHVPSAVQERASQLSRAEDEIRTASGANATTRDIARHLGLELGEVAEAQGALQANRPGSLDATSADEDGQRLTLRETIGEFDPAFAQIEATVGWEDVLRRLQPRERKVVLLRFVCGFTQDEIARRVGVSQMHVSRILRHAAAALAAAPELR